MMRATSRTLFFFFNDTATTEIYTLSLHDALPIWNLGSIPDCRHRPLFEHVEQNPIGRRNNHRPPERADRKSTRLNSSHSQISYAVFCLQKKNQHYSINGALAGPPLTQT